MDQGIVMKHLFYLRKYVLSPIRSCKGVDTGQLLLKCRSQTLLDFTVKQNIPNMDNFKTQDGQTREEKME